MNGDPSLITLAGSDRSQSDHGIACQAVIGVTHVPSTVVTLSSEYLRIDYPYNMVDSISKWLSKVTITIEESKGNLLAENVVFISYIGIGVASTKVFDISLAILSLK